VNRTKSLVEGLPSEVSWSYKLFEANPSEWEKRGTDSTHYFFKQFKPGTTEFQRAQDLFRFNCDDVKLSLTFQKCIAIYNPLLITQFVGTWQIQVGRSLNAPHLFSASHWDKSNELRKWVYGQFRKFANRFPWNVDNLIPIVPVFHGTDMPVAEKICETGFATLSSIDAGYFGKGIYFTPDQAYTIPYIVSRRQPTLILSWVVPGNVFPVTESHCDPAVSLLGSAIKSGYNSHWVVCRRDGMAVSTCQENDSYAEVVIPQESQIVPAFIFLLDGESVRTAKGEWMRVVISDDGITATKAQKALINYPPSKEEKRSSSNEKVPRRESIKRDKESAKRDKESISGFFANLTYNKKYDAV